MHDELNLERILEAVLLTASDPLSVKKLCALLDQKQSFSESDVKSALQALTKTYEGRALTLIEVARGFRFQVAEDMVPWVLQAQAEKPGRLSPAFLETLALIAYRQPMTRADIEAVRGVAVSAHILRSMLERGWVKVVGHREVPGRPELLATTPQFLDDFNLKSLADLPDLADSEASDEPEASSEQLSLDVDSQASHDDASTDVEVNDQPMDEAILEDDTVDNDALIPEGLEPEQAS